MFKDICRYDATNYTRLQGSTNFFIGARSGTKKIWLLKAKVQSRHN